MQDVPKKPGSLCASVPHIVSPLHSSAYLGIQALNLALDIIASYSCLGKASARSPFLSWAPTSQPSSSASSVYRVSASLSVLSMPDVDSPVLLRMSTCRCWSSKARTSSALERVIGTQHDIATASTPVDNDAEAMNTSASPCTPASAQPHISRISDASLPEAAQEGINTGEFPLRAALGHVGMLLTLPIAPATFPDGSTYMFSLGISLKMITWATSTTPDTFRTSSLSSGSPLSRSQLTPEVAHEAGYNDEEANVQEEPKESRGQRNGIDEVGFASPKILHDFLPFSSLSEAI